MSIKPQFIFFDLDGTIINSKMSITTCIQHTLKYFGIVENNLDNLEKFIGPPLDISFHEFYGFDKEQCAVAIQKYREIYDKEGITANIVYEGIPELLSKLKSSGKTLVVATSKYYGAAINILKHFNLDGFFTFIAGSKIDNRRSGKDDVINYALETLEIEASSDIFMIGDRKFDIIGAKKTGLTSVGVLYGFGSQEEMELAGADYIAKDIKHLENILL